MVKKCYIQGEVLFQAGRLADEMLEKPDPQKIPDFIEIIDKTMPHLSGEEQHRMVDAKFRLKEGGVENIKGAAGVVTKTISIPLMLATLSCASQIKD